MSTILPEIVDTVLILLTSTVQTSPSFSWEVTELLCGWYFWLAQYYFKHL